MSQAVALPGALWARAADVDAQRMPLWRAFLIALGVELLVPLLLFGVDWSFLPFFEPPPVPVMSVRLEPPPDLTPAPPQEKPKPRREERQRERIRSQVPIEIPKPLPDEVPSKVELPKPIPKPKPKPKEERKEPEPLPEVPPLPSVFRDIKPVKKVKPKYPPEAEAQHIQGRVKVRLDVALDGSVTGVEILISEPPGVFDEAVLEAVRQYQFKRDGTTYQADQEILFKLDE